MIEAPPRQPAHSPAAARLAERPTGPGSPSLVPPTHNSAKPEKRLRFPGTSCPDARPVRVFCELHCRVGYTLVPCKKRDCETCGPAGRHQIARRLALGVRQFWPAAWIVLTFADDVDKKKCVRQLGRFVKTLRTKRPGLQYAATYELTRKGRLHINLLVGNWSYVRQTVLQQIWGARLWVQWIKNDATVGNEAAKSYSPESLGGYLAKLEQVVPTDRRVSFSKHWPKLSIQPDNPTSMLTFTPLLWEEARDFYHDLHLGRYAVVHPGLWAVPTIDSGLPKLCPCFFNGLDPPESSQIQL